MNSEILATKSFIKNGLQIIIDFEAIYNGDLGQSNFYDQWEVSDHHIGGITIRLNNQNFKPLQYSLSDLSKDYAKQGRFTPSYDAYKSLQEQLIRDSEAFKVILNCRVLKNSIELASECLIGSDYHYNDYDYDHDKALHYLYSDYGNIEHVIAEANKMLCEC